MVVGTRVGRGRAKIQSHPYPSVYHFSLLYPCDSSPQLNLQFTAQLSSQDPGLLNPGFVLCILPTSPGTSTFLKP